MMKLSICILVVLCSLVNASLEPSHVYLSLTGVSTQVQVTFTTTTLPTRAQVVYGLASDNTTTTVDVASTDIVTFKRPTTDVMNYISSATLGNLARGQVYRYKIIGDSKNASSTSSKEFSFRYIPADGAPVTLGIYGDLGSYGYALMQSSANGLPSWAARGKFDVVIHNGDLAYNLGTDNGTVGDEFMKNVEAVTSVVPYVVTPGNHEFMNGGDDEKYYRNFWAGQSLLGKNSKSTTPTMWFSFDIGTVHVVGISTEVYCEDTKNIAIQYEWLQKDLEAAYSRSPRPWIVVFGHRPLFEAGISHLHSRLMKEGLLCTDATYTSCNPLKSCNGGKYCAYSIEDLLVKYRVDMFIAGHVHSYIRQNPIYPNSTFEAHPDPKNYVNPQTTVHIISGAAGTAHLPESAEIIRDFSGETPAVVDTRTYSFSTLVAFNSSYIQYQQISAEDGALIDEFWIIKNKEAPNFKLVDFTIDKDVELICDQ